MQPYNTGDETLLILSELDVIGKHRRLNTLGLELRLDRVDFVPGVRVLESDIPEWVPYEDDAQVARFVLGTPLPDGDVEMDSRFLFGVTVDEGPPFCGNLTSLLGPIRDEVVRITNSFDHAFK